MRRACARPARCRRRGRSAPTRSRACAHASRPDLPSAPMTHTVAPGCASRATCAGAPATSSTASATPGGMSSGSRAYTPLSNSTALPRTRTCPVATSTWSIASRRSGVSVSDTSDAMRSPTASSSRGVRAARSGRRARRTCRRCPSPDCAACRARRPSRARARRLLRVAVAQRADLRERGGVDVERLDVAHDLVRVRARRVVEPPRPLRQRAFRLEHAVRAERQSRRSSPSASTGSPTRSKGVERTIVVRVRATPGTRLSLVRNSSRWAVDRVTTLSTNVSSPATLCTSSTSGNACTACVNAS